MCEQIRIQGQTFQLPMPTEISLWRHLFYDISAKHVDVVRVKLRNILHLAKSQPLHTN